MPKSNHPAITRYLQELEKEIKQQNGVVPEEAITDALEHCSRQLSDLISTREDLSDPQIFQKLAEDFGTPDIVAKQYAAAVEFPTMNLPGYAPGWRIHCIKCGRSKLAAKAGIIRVGSPGRLTKKWTLGWCRGCSWFRFLRISRDVQCSNLTHKLQNDTSSIPRRRKVLVALLLFTVAGTVLSPSAGGELPTVFQKLPTGWKIEKTWSMPKSQIQKIADKWQLNISGIENTVVSFGDDNVQINTIVCPDKSTASKVAAKIRATKNNPRMVCQSNLNVYEFVVRKGRDFEVALAARDAFGIWPKQVAYQVSFKATPILDGDWMKLNQFVNEAAASSEDTTRLKQLAASFKPSDDLVLREFGQGDTRSAWKLKKVSPRAGLRCWEVTGTVNSYKDGVTPAGDDKADKYLSATKLWPNDEIEIQRLAKKITAGLSDTKSKSKAIQSWMRSKQGIRFGGDVTGSRYGTKQVIKQKFGHCWDFSDVFITLCRASGVPTRQVYGWIYGSEGHVWAEVLIDGGWHAVDPTGSLTCGSDYVPFATSFDGVMPLIYTSIPELHIIREHK